MTTSKVLLPDYCWPVQTDTGLLPLFNTFMLTVVPTKT